MSLPPPIALIGQNALQTFYQVLSEQNMMDHAVPPQTSVSNMHYAKLLFDNA
jgi:hypothetical protein